MQYKQARAPDHRLYKIYRRAGQRYPDHIAFGVAQAPKIDRHRLGIAKQKRARGAEVQQQRQQDGAHWVDVFQGVERDAAQHPGGVVAKVARCVAVRRFMQGDGKNHRYRVEADGLNQVCNVHVRAFND